MHLPWEVGVVRCLLNLLIFIPSLAFAGSVEVYNPPSSGSGLSSITSNANQFSGDGSSGNALTLKSSSVTLLGSGVNGPNQPVQLNGSGQYPAIDGSLITNISAGGNGVGWSRASGSPGQVYVTTATDAVVVQSSFTVNQGVNFSTYTFAFNGNTMFTSHSQHAMSPIAYKFTSAIDNYTSAGAGCVQSIDVSSSAVYASTQAIKMVTPGGSVICTSSATALISTDFTGKYPVAYVMVADTVNITGGSLEVSLCSDQALANCYKWNMSTDLTILSPPNSWRRMPLSWSDAIVSGSPNKKAIISSEWTFQDLGTATTMWASAVTIENERPATALIMADDGHTDICSTFTAIANQYGIHVTLFVPAEKGGVGNPPSSTYCSFAQLHAAQDAGHEIATHASENFQTYGDQNGQAALETDMGQIKAQLQSNGFTGADDMAWPNGAYDSISIAAAQRVFRSARGISKVAEKCPPSDPYSYRSQVLFATDSCASISAKLDTCQQQGNTCGFVFHRIDTPGDTHNWTSTMTACLFQHIKDIGIQTKTVGEWLNEENMYSPKNIAGQTIIPGGGWAYVSTFSATGDLTLAGGLTVTGTSTHTGAAFFQSNLVSASTGAFMGQDASGYSLALSSGLNLSAGGCINFASGLQCVAAGSGTGDFLKAGNNAATGNNTWFTGSNIFQDFIASATSRSGNYIMTSTDAVVFANCPSTCTITLPAASGNLGKPVDVYHVNATSNPVYVAGNGSDLIMSTNSFAMYAQGQSIHLVSDGASNWWGKVPLQNPFIGYPMDPTVASAVGTSSNTYFMAVSVNEPVFATGMRFHVSASAGGMDTGIYDAWGKKIASTGNTPVPAIGNASLNFTSAVLLYPGLYYLAILADNTTATFTKAGVDSVQGMYVQTGSSGSMAAQATLPFTPASSGRPYSLSLIIAGGVPN